MGLIEMKHGAIAEINKLNNKKDLLRVLRQLSRISLC